MCGHCGAILKLGLPVGLTLGGNRRHAGEGAEFARRLGCRRVVLGRELSIPDITKAVQGSQAEIEVFVHGALCVSYSGQCYSSEAWGGRSANRGQCAQVCPSSSMSWFLGISCGGLAHLHFCPSARCTRRARSLTLCARSVTNQAMCVGVSAAIRHARRWRAS